LKSLLAGLILQVQGQGILVNMGKQGLRDIEGIQEEEDIVLFNGAFH